MDSNKLFKVWLAYLSSQLSALEPSPPSDLIVLSLGESAQIGGASISFESVDEESRCARGVQCIWAGRAVVSIHVAVFDGIFELSLVDGATRDQESRTGDAASLSLTLLRVSPYPIDEVSVALDDYRVHLLVDAN